ncbi:uncharacterized protein LOC124278909 isoform X3 [Haliotis rubra]|uniref:uncharacterized protein LOC124278909 isoform X3 n=1 Tax=Haliotis rubra TaxID=36100 RepID=UPI001EE5711C|nr:uncharacterized protein LOC124278909 isoform X3 [Haliotis rubra]
MTSPRQLQGGTAAVFQQDELPHTPVEVPSFRDQFDGRSTADNRPGRDLFDGRSTSDNRPERDLFDGRSTSDNRPGRDLFDGRSTSDNRPGRDLFDGRSTSDNRPGRDLFDGRSTSDNRPGRELHEGRDVNDHRLRGEQEVQDGDSDRTARRFLEERRKMAESKARRQLRSRTSRESTSFLLKHKRTIIGTSFAVGAVVGLAAVVGILASGNTEPVTTTIPPTTTSLPPFLSMSNVSFFQGEGDLYLPCRISGDQIIFEVLFFKDGVQVKDGFSIEVSGRLYTLTKKGATCSDSGQYECRATGDFGTLNRTSMVNISSKPCNPTLEDAWQIILKNISINPNSTTQQECSSSSVHCEVPQACNGTSGDADPCCYLIDNAGKTLHLKGCENVTFAAGTYETNVSPCDCTAGRVAVPRPTTYPDNCNLYYTCSGGVKQDATCTGSDIFSADPSTQACTANPGDSYCAKVNAGEIKTCSSPAG